MEFQTFKTIKLNLHLSRNKVNTYDIMAFSTQNSSSRTTLIRTVKITIQRKYYLPHVFLIESNVLINPKYSTSNEENNSESHVFPEIKREIEQINHSLCLS